MMEILHFAAMFIGGGLVGFALRKRPLDLILGFIGVALLLFGPMLKP